MTRFDQLITEVRRSMYLLIACLTLLCAVACVGEPWQPDEFPISYWSGPRISFNTLETWQTVRDCNFTFCGTDGGYSVEANKKRLDLCEQLGLKALVVDGRISWEMVAQDDWRETIAEIVADYGSHPALYGYYLKDEPNYQHFEALGEISREFEAQDPAHLPYINLFPTYASVQQLGTPTYEDHLDKFLSIVKPRVLSYDHYCLLRDGGIRPDYFENLGLIRDYGPRYGVPPWNTSLSLAHLAYRDPTEAEMRWQIYTSLAYGMKGIMYFTYWTNGTLAAQERFGIVDDEGKPARLYPIVSQLNAEMKALGKTLLGLTSTGVYHTGEVPAGGARLGTDAIVRLPDDMPLLIGFFKDAEGGDFAMIVNRDYQEPMEFEATLLPHIVGVAEVSPADGSEAPASVEGQKLSLRLEPGDGKLFRLQTEFEYPEPPRPISEITFQFDRDGDLEGWGSFHSLGSPTVKGGVLTMSLGGQDPHFSRTFLRIPADKYATIKMRMSISGCQPTAQLFWATAEEPQFRDDKYLNFATNPDGQWHEYEIPVAEHAKWRGQQIRALRLDPSVGGTEPGAKVRIDWIVGE